MKRMGFKGFIKELSVSLIFISTRKKQAEGKALSISTQSHPNDGAGTYRRHPHCERASTKM